MSLLHVGRKDSLPKRKAWCLRGEGGESSTCVGLGFADRGPPAREILVQWLAWERRCVVALGRSHISTSQTGAADDHEDWIRNLRMGGATPEVGPTGSRRTEFEEADGEDTYRILEV